MSRFVVLSFAFLGWVFFELSGGVDFAPPERPEPIAQIKPEKPSDLRTVIENRVTAASLVSQPVIQLPIIQRRQEPRHPERPAADPNLRSTVALAQIASIGNGLGSSRDAFADQSGTGDLQLASLDSGLAGLTVSTTTPEQAAGLIELPQQAPDIRQVTGSRVNMRGGPGTIYPVTARLVRDQEVEVLRDSGTGWLRLRFLEEDRIGWIAASLISKKRP